MIDKLSALYNAASHLRDDMSAVFNYRLHEGLGDSAIATYQALYEEVYATFRDKHLESLQLRLPEKINDRQKIALVMMLAGQLKAYLEKRWAESSNESPDSDSGFKPTV